MPASTGNTPTLYQRIAKVQSALEGISATGHNQFSAKALSIGDVENALRKPLADAGIVTRWSYVELAQIEKGLWRAHLKVTVCSADSESDLFDDEWIDIGGNPMAATSFARKGYLKALFHITEEGDEQGRTETHTEPQRQAEPARTAIPPARVQSKPRVTVQWTLLDRGCPDCGDGSLRVGVMPDGKSFIGCTNYPTCKHTEQVPREGSAAAVAGDVDPGIPF